jgi:hypothetical protein
LTVVCHMQRTWNLTVYRDPLLRLPDLLHQDPVPGGGGASRPSVGQAGASQEGEGAPPFRPARHEQGQVT